MPRRRGTGNESKGNGKRNRAAPRPVVTAIATEVALPATSFAVERRPGSVRHVTGARAGLLSCRACVYRAATWNGRHRRPYQQRQSKCWELIVKLWQTDPDALPGVRCDAVPVLRHIGQQRRAQELAAGNHKFYQHLLSNPGPRQASPRVGLISESRPAASARSSPTAPPRPLQSPPFSLPLSMAR
jgi:hypothetical protein